MLSLSLSVRAISLSLSLFMLVLSLSLYLCVCYPSLSLSLCPVYLSLCYVSIKLHPFFLIAQSFSTSRGSAIDYILIDNNPFHFTVYGPTVILFFLRCLSPSPSSPSPLLMTFFPIKNHSYSCRRILLVLLLLIGGIIADRLVHPSLGHELL